MAQITDPGESGPESGAADASAVAAWVFRDGDEDLRVATDAEGRILDADAAWTRLLGWTPEDIRGLPLECLAHPRDVPAQGLQAVDAVIVRFRCKTGGWRTFNGDLTRPSDDKSDDPPLEEPRQDASENPELLELRRIQGVLALASGVWRWMIDPVAQTIKITIGNAVERDTGRSQSLADLNASLHPDDHDMVTGILHKAMREGGSGIYDSRVRQPDGSWRCFRISYVTDPHEGGLFYVHGLSQDITELATVRDAALESAGHLSMALGAAGAAVAALDFKTLTAWCSPGFADIVGQELTFASPDTPPWPMCHEEDRERLDAGMANWTGDRHETVQFRAVLPSGDCRWVEVHGERELDDVGGLAKIICLVLDVDARKQQELALAGVREVSQANAERLKVAMDAAHAGVFETDFINQTFWCSPEFETIVGTSMTFEEAAGIWPSMHPDDAAMVKAGIERSRQGSPSECAEWRIRLPNGAYRWIEARAVVHHNADGGVERLTGVVLDIDTRKRQELALIEAERDAHAAVEAKTQFLANMSHEIRTPMNGVLGVLHLLGGESLSSEAKRMLDEAERCGRMLSQLLNDVIDISKIEAGRMELELEPLDPAALLEGVADLLRQEAVAKGLTLDVQIGGERHWVQADPVRLRQALFNLIGNAVKFTSEGRLEARLFLSKFPGQRRLLRFEIEDTGVGIPISAQRALFESFTQADGSFARRYGGSGLGLAITRRLAELMGGAVSFSSTEGIGSIFCLEFPAAEAEPAPVGAALHAGDGPPLQGLSVLVVEDNATNRLVATKLLESLGARVDTADDGVEGVEAVQRKPYDLVLMDIQMPRMDGVEATRRIRALDGEIASIPIVALTANVMASQLETYLKVGMNGVAAKPISVPALLDQIGRAVVAPKAETEAEHAA